MFTHSVIIIKIIYEYLLGAKKLSLPMRSSNKRDVGLPWFEDFTGWLVHFKASPRKHGAHAILE